MVNQAEEADGLELWTLLVRHPVPLLNPFDTCKWYGTLIQMFMRSCLPIQAQISPLWNCFNVLLPNFYWFRSEGPDFNFLNHRTGPVMFAILRSIRKKHMFSNLNCMNIPKINRSAKPPCCKLWNTWSSQKFTGQKLIPL